MQTLFIPDNIQIDIADKDGNPFCHENVLVGIQTFATHKNDINLFPFLSDKQGQITISKEQIRDREDKFISWGIMDYVRIDYAKPGIKIYFWGTDRLEKYINFQNMILKNISERLQYEEYGEIMGDYAKRQVELESKDREELKLFETCFNRKTKQKDDILLVEDLWDKPSEMKKYQVSLIC